MRLHDFALERFSARWEFSAELLLCASDDLVRETGVLLLPGTVFADTSDRFRIGFGRTNLPVALERLEAYAGRRFGPR